MKKTNTFQTILLVVFGFSIMIALILFAIYKPDKGEEVNYGTVKVWGTLPATVVKEAIESIEAKNITIVYEQKGETSLQQDLIESLAVHSGPDLVILPYGEFVDYKKYLHPVPYEYFSERDFRNTYIDQAELYLSDSGEFALPLMVDPIVMYWNKEIFSSNAISMVPTVWDEFKVLAPSMTVRDDTKITRSAIPFGQYANVDHAKDIISMLIMQAGAPIVSSNKGQLTVNLNGDVNSASPAVAAIEFFMEFSNSSLPTYSWNRSLSSSKEMFIAGESAVYFGYASEAEEIEKTNPHLSFDVAVVPQVRETKRKLTFGRMNGVGVLEKSKETDGNMTGSLYAARLMTSGSIAEKLSKDLNLPPASRILLAKDPGGVYLPVFYDSAIISTSWADPNPKETSKIFEDTIEGILSSRYSVDTAVSGMERQLRQVIEQFVGKK